MKVARVRINEVFQKEKGVQGSMALLEEEIGDGSELFLASESDDEKVKFNTIVARLREET